MSGNNGRDVDHETDICRVQLRCSCGDAITAESEYGVEMDISTKCDGCGRRHVVTITEVRGAAGNASTIER